VLHPLYLYSFRVGGVGVSIDRIVLLVVILLFPSYVLFNRRISSPVFFTFLLFSIVVLVFNAFLTPSVNNAKLPAIFSLAVFLLFFALKYTDEQFQEALNISFVIYFSFTVYGLFHFYYYGTSLIYKPFYTLLPFLDSPLVSKAEHLAKGYSFLPRFQFPFATPPHLALVNGLFALYYYYLLLDKACVGKKKYITQLFFLLALLSVILTQSRSGAFALLAAILIFLFLKGRLIKGIVKYTIGFFIFAAILILSIGIDDLLLLTKRLIDLSVLNEGSGHYSSRVDGFIFFQDLFLYEKLFGIGIGNYPDLHTHMSYLTILIERGLLGLLIFIAPLMLVISNFMLITLKKGSTKRLSSPFIYHFVGVLMIYIAHLFYEFTYVIPIYIFLGYHLRYILSISHVHRA